jgi:hypothetical protein
MERDFLHAAPQPNPSPNVDGGTFSLSLEFLLARVPPFHNVLEARKPPDQRVYHDNDRCSLGRLIRDAERRSGTAGLRICKECYSLDLTDPPLPSKWV